MPSEEGHPAYQSMYTDLLLQKDRNNNIHDIFSSTLFLFNTDAPDTCRP